MARVRVVLVRPENSANIGAASRVIMNTGLDGLDLVEPGDWRTLEAWRTAWRAEDILEQARTFDTLADALKDAVYVAGFAGRSSQTSGALQERGNPVRTPQIRSTARDRSR